MLPRGNSVLCDATDTWAELTPQSGEDDAQSQVANASPAQQQALGAAVRPIRQIGAMA
jgi:hypothetical protein